MTCSFRFFGHVNQKSVRDNLNMRREFEKINKTSHLFCFVIAFYPAKLCITQPRKKNKSKCRRQPQPNFSYSISYPFFAAINWRPKEIHVWYRKTKQRLDMIFKLGIWSFNMKILVLAWPKYRKNTRKSAQENAQPAKEENQGASSRSCWRAWETRAKKPRKPDIQTYKRPNGIDLLHTKPT